MPPRITLTGEACVDPSERVSETFHGDLILHRVRCVLERAEEVDKRIALEVETNERARNPRGAECLREPRGGVTVGEQHVALGCRQVDGSQRSAGPDVASMRKAGRSKEPLPAQLTAYRRRCRE